MTTAVAEAAAAGGAGTATGHTLDASLAGGETVAGGGAETAAKPAGKTAARRPVRRRRPPRRKPVRRRAAPSGPWTEAHVNRLFWRAGFGARPDEAAFWVKQGRSATLRYVLDGGPQGSALVGPAPSVEGRPLDPVNEWAHDGLWWLDRMVRSQRPLQEKMTLFWHDHFATNDQDTPLMLAQNRTFRRHALGSFPKLLRAVTLDPAMQLFLSLPDSDKEHPNENFARELMELFTLGKGYSEGDIRQAARALTGFRARWNDNGFGGIYYDRERHDAGVKRIFGQRGRFAWTDVLELAVAHPNHAPFLATKLWEFFVASPPSRATVRNLAGIYRRSGHRLKPVLAAILDHPALYRNLDAPDMVKSPIVFVAGTLRTNGLGVTYQSLTWMLDNMGQRPFDPPSVAGWEWGPAWMSSNSMRVRFDWGNRLIDDDALGPKPGTITQPPASPAEALEQALAAVGRPWISGVTRSHLLEMAARFFDDLTPRTRPQRRIERAEMLQRSLRLILLAGPDAQLH
ncbi:MAG TPA: DUF1800 domain-containing protein [Solirubrobacteraceae bacterium]|nr:DUF1800 domain-containing protein [Solirubrobacteraceae bacterium]